MIGKWAAKRVKKAGRKSEITLGIRFETLEERILLSADGALVPLDLVREAGWLPAAETVVSGNSGIENSGGLSASLTASLNISGQGVKSSLVIVDPSLPDYETLVSQIPDRENQTLVLLNPETDGLDQITQILSRYRNLDAVHILSHGAEGVLQLGNGWLDSADLSGRADQVKTWRNALSPEADLLLYGCKAASGETGMAFAEALAELTGADVAASADETASSDVSGNWNLEVHTGPVDTESLFAGLDPEYNHGLDFVPVAGAGAADTLIVDLSTWEILQNGVRTGTLDIEDNTISVDGMGGWDSLEIRGTGYADTINVTSSGLVIETPYIDPDDPLATVINITTTITFQNIESLMVSGGEGLDSLAAGSLTLSGAIQLSAETLTVNTGAVLTTGSGSSGSTYDLTLSGAAITLGVDSQLLSNGGAMGLTAPTLNLNAGVILSTRRISGTDFVEDDSTGDSGNITLSGTAITLGTGSKLLAHAPGAGGFDAGNILLRAEDLLDSAITLIPFADITTTHAEITLNSATMMGGAVSIEALADSKHTFTDNETGEFVLDFIASESILGGGADSSATARITVGDGSVIHGNTLTITTHALTEAEVDTTAVFLGVAVAISTPVSEVIVGNAELHSAGDLTLSAIADGKLSAVSRSNFMGVVNTGEFADLTVAVGQMEGNALVQTASGSVVTAGGTATLSSEFIKDANVFASSTTNEDGMAGVAVAVSYSRTRAEALLNGRLESQGSLVVSAKNSVPYEDGGHNDTSANAGAGLGALGRAFKGLKDAALIGKFENYLTGKMKALDPGSGGPRTVALSGAIAVADQEDNAKVSFLSQADVTSVSGDITATAMGKDMPEIASSATVDNTPSGSGSTEKKNAAALALVIGNYDHTTETLVGAGALVDAGGDVTLLAETVLPYEIQWQKIFQSDQGLQDWLDKMNTNFGIQNGFFTSWAKANATGTEKTGAASINLLTLNNTSRVKIDENALINTRDDVFGTVALGARNEIEAVHFAGQPFPYMNTNFAGGSGAGAAWLDISYVNTAEAQIQSWAEVHADALAVQADNDTSNIAISATHGVADGAFSINGSVSVLDMDNRSVASIDDGARIETGAALVEIPRLFDFVSTDPTLALGVQSIFDPAYAVDDTDHTLLVFSGEHGWETGDAVVYSNGGGENIGNLTDGEIYFIIRVDENTVNLSRTFLDAASGTAIVLDKTDAEGAAHRLDRTFDPTADGAVDVDEEILDLGYDHGLSTGQAVAYCANGGDEIGGLEDGQVYYAVKVDDTRIKLSPTNSGALLPAPTLKDLTSSGTGAFHSLTPAGIDSGIGGYFVDAFSADLGQSIVGQTATTLQTDLNLLVSATDNAQIYNIGGAVTKGRTAGIGATVARNLIDRDTQAYIGNETLGLGVNGQAPGVGVDGTTDSLNLGYAHGFASGEAVVYDSGGGPEIDGLTDGGTYYVITIPGEPTLLKLSTSDTLDDVIDLDPATADGNAHSIARAFDPATVVDSQTDTLTFTFPHGFSTGQAVAYNNGGGASIGGLQAGEIFYVIALDENAFQLAETRAEALAGKALDLAASAAEGTAHTLGAAFHATPCVDGSLDQITLEFPHGLSTGDALVYDNGGGTSIGGLTNGEIYYVVEIDAFSFQLARTLEDATAPTPVVRNLDPSPATGDQHSFRSPQSADGLVNAGGKVKVSAQNDGSIFSLSLAGSLVSETETARSSLYKEGKQPADKAAPKYGISVSGSVAVNDIRGQALGFVSDGTLATPSTTVLEATNTSGIFSITGAAALSTSNASKTAGIAGAVSLNTIEDQTRAFIHGATVSADGGLSLNAEATGDIKAFSASIAGVPKKNGLGIAGQVGINTVNGTTLASIENSLVQAGSLTLTSSAANSIFAVAGAVQYGGKAGFGASVAVNRITRDTRSIITGVSSNAVHISRDILLDARNDSEIFTISAAIGISPEGFAAAFSVAVNLISPLTQACITDSGPVNAVSAGGNLFLQALDDADIFAFIGAGTYSESFGLGVSFSYNAITGSAVASIENAGVDVSGDVLLTSDLIPLEDGSDPEKTIHALAIAGALAVNDSAVTVAGAVTVNHVRFTSEARISRGAKVSSEGRVRLKALDRSRITADAGGVAIAVSKASEGASGTHLAGAVGASVAVNDIENTIRANIDSAEITSDGNLELSALSASTIDALTIGAAVAAGASKQGTNVSLAGAGAFSFNDIGNTTEAKISTVDHVESFGGSITLSAQDQSTIQADGGGVAVSVAMGSKSSGGGLSVGASVADNETRNQTRAVLDNSLHTGDDASILAAQDIRLSAASTATIDVLSIGGAVSVGDSGQTGLSGAIAGAVSLNTIENTIEAGINGFEAVESASGGIYLTSTDTATITADTVGGAISWGSGTSGAGFSLAVGVAVANNQVNNTVKAFIQDSTVSSGTDMVLAAVSSGTIQAFSLAASVSVGVSADETGIAISGGCAYSQNTILSSTEAKALNSSLASGGDISLSSAHTGTINATVLAIAASVGAGTNAGVAAAIGASFACNDIGWDGDSQVPAGVRAYLENAFVDAAGDLDLSAIADENVNATVIAGSVAIAASKGVGVGLAGSGVDAQNRISTRVRAYIEGDGEGEEQGIEAADIRLIAKDDSFIEANAGAAALAATFAGKAAVSIAVGVALADNLIQNEISAYISGADSVQATGGEIRIEAVEDAEVDAVSVAASLALAGGLSTSGPPKFAMALTGAGADADNDIGNRVSAYITRSSLETLTPAEGFAEDFADYLSTEQAATLHTGKRVLVEGNEFNETEDEIYEYIGGTDLNAVDLSAEDYSDAEKWRKLGPDIVIKAVSSATITAVTGAASVSISVGDKVSAAGAIGVALAENRIGGEEGDPLQNAVLAYADHSTLISAEDIQIQADSTDRVSAVSFAGSVAVAAGGIGISGAGVGAELTNTLQSKVHAYVSESDVEAQGNIDVQAISDSQITEAGAIGVAVALSLAPKGVAISVAASLSDNVISNDVQAYVSGGEAILVQAGHDIFIVADATAKISDAYGTSVSVSAGFIAGAGGGIDIDNVIDENVTATVTGSLTLLAGGDIQVLAREEAFLNADATAVTAALGLGASIGVALLRNQINSDISASVVDATLMSTNTVIRALSDADIAKTTSAGISAGLATAAANRADADIATRIQAYSQNAVLMSFEDISITASAENDNKANAWGGALGGIAVGAMIGDVTLGRGEAVDEVTAAVGDGTRVSARTLTITAISDDDLLAESIAAGGGVLAAAGAESNVTSDMATKVTIGDDVHIEVDTLMARSLHIQDMDASADSYSVALVAGSGAGVNNRITGKAGVSIGDATVNAGNILITAKNEITKTEYKDRANLRSGSASAGNVTILLSETFIGTEENPFEAKVDIGSGAHLAVNGNQDNPGVFKIEAVNDITAMDSVRIESVSGFGVGVGNSRIFVYSDASVNLNDALLESNAGDVYLTARTDSSVNPSASLLTASAVTGLVGANAHGETHADNTIGIHSSTVKGSDVYLLAGRDSAGVPNLLDSYAATEVTAISFFPSVGLPFSEAEINETNTISITGTAESPSAVRALEDITLVAKEGLGGEERAKADGRFICLSVPPYGFSADADAEVVSTNTVGLDGFSFLEAGINNQSVVHILPVTVNNEAQLDPDRIGTRLTSQEKTDLGLGQDLSYEYGALNLTSITVSIAPGDVVLNADTGNYYRYTGPFDLESTETVNPLRQGDRVKTAVGSIGANRGEVYAYIGPNSLSPVDLSTQDYSNASCWVQVTGPAVDLDLMNQDYLNTDLWEALVPEEITEDMAYIESDSTLSLQQSLEGKFYVIKPVSLGDVTLSLKNVGAMLMEQRDQILSWMTNHAANAEAVARYAVQLAVLDQTLAELGVFETVELEDGGTLTVLNKNLDALFVQLPDIYAAPGSIFIETDPANQAAITVLAPGQLSTHAGANIQVVNETPFSMVVNDAVIRDNRKVKVTDDGVYTVMAPGAVYFNDLMVPGTGQAASGQAPEITITQPVIPTSVYDLGDLTLPDLDQDIYIAGKVVNESGYLTLVNQEGSIHVTGEIRADHVDIQAAKDFNLTTEDWFHTGRDPRQYINYDLYRALSRTSANALEYALASQVTGLSQALADDTSAILAQGNINISARYLNVDGLIQSGARAITLIVDEDFAPGKTTSLLGINGKPIQGVSFGEEGVPVDAVFDLEKQAIVVSDIIPKGGSIVLAGQIFSTGNGRIQVAHGYADVRIENHSDYTLIVNRIDTTTDREGIITLVDTGRLQKTVYAATESQITETVYQGTPGTEVTREDGVISTMVYEQIGFNPYDLNETVQFEPLEGLRYLWTEGQEFTKVVVTKYEKNSFNLFGDADWMWKDASYTWRTITYRDQVPLLESEVLVIDVLPANGETSGTTYILSPDYTAGMAYTIDYDLKEDLDVELVPGDLIKVVAGHTAGGVPGNRYAYIGQGEDLILSEQNYGNVSLWSDVTATTTDAQVTYASDYVNASTAVQNWTTGGGWLRKKTVHTLTTEITGKQDFYTHTLKADYPIDIAFLQGSETPEIRLLSGGDLLLQGNIRVPDVGAIDLESVHGSVKTDESAAVFDVSPEVDAGKDVVLNVEGGIGPLDIQAGGDITVNAVYNPSAADPNSRLLVGSVESTGGDVFLNGSDGIFGVNENAQIQGDLIELFSGNGGIGTEDLAIRINSHVAGGGGLAAKARDSIFIQETTGDLNLAKPESWKTAAASVESFSGDVFLTALAGSILDAYPETYTPPSEAEADALDERQGLTGDAALEAVKLSIRMEESAKTQAYHDYWALFRNAAPDSVSREILLSGLDAENNEIHCTQAHGLSTGDEIFVSIEGSPDAPETNLHNGFAYYAVVKDENTLQLALSRYDAALLDHPAVLDLTLAEIGDFSLMKILVYDYSADSYDPDLVVDEKVQSIHEEYGSTPYDADFIFHLSAAEKAERLDQRVFTSDALQYPMNRELFSYLYPEAQGAIPPGGDIMENTNVSGNRVVLKATMEGAGVGRSTGVAFIDFSQGYDALDPLQKQMLSLASVEDILEVTRNAGGEPTGIFLEIWNDINVETHSLDVEAADSAALQSDHDMNIDHVEAGGRVRLETGGALTDLHTHAEAAVAAGGNLILLADDEMDGRIGAEESRFRMDLEDPATFTARAGVSIHLQDVGNLHLDTVTAPLADLSASGSILDGSPDDGANLVAANTLTLQSGGGIGTEDNDVDFDSPDSETWVFTASAAQSLYLTEVTGPLVINDFFSVVSQTGDIRFTVADTANTGEDLRVAGAKVRALHSPSGSVILRAGDDLFIEDEPLIEAALDVLLYMDFGNADAGAGGRALVLAPIHAAAVKIHGNSDDDAYELSHVVYADDTPAPLWTLDGGDGGDHYTMNLEGSGQSDLRVSDSGTLGTDELTVNATTGDDTLLFRRDFLALLRPDGLDGQGKVKYNPAFERIQYDETCDHMTVNTGAGEDLAAFDDTGVALTLNTGAGADEINIGQMFRSTPTGLDTLETTLGHLSNGVSFTTEVFAGEGDDTLTVYRNLGELTLNGETGDDAFVIRAFARGGTSIDGGGGSDTIEYAANAPVDISGGDGLDHVFVIGSEQADHFAVTENGVYGAGIHNTYAGVEYVTLDGYIGDDTFYVLAIPESLAVRILGSYGSDAIHVAGAPEGADLNALVVTDVPVDYVITNTLGSIAGPLHLEGGFGDIGARPIHDPVNLPGQGEDDETYTHDELVDDLNEEESLDRVFVHDTAATEDSHGLLTRDRLTGFNMGQGAVIGGIEFDAGFGYVDFEDLTLAMGSGNDLLDIHTTHGGNTTVIAGNGNDTVNIGGPGFSGTTVNGISGWLEIHGGEGSDTLNVDDTGEDRDNAGTLTGDTLTGLGLDGGIRYFGMEDLAMGLGSGHDLFNIQGTAALTRIEGNQGNEIFNVSSNTDDLSQGSLDFILGDLFLSGGAGIHTLNVSDYGDPDGDSGGVITRNSLSGLAPAVITYETDGSFGGGVNIDTSRGNDALAIRSTRADSVTAIRLNAGDDRVILSHDNTGINGLVALFGEDGNDALEVDDPDTWTTPLILFGDYGVMEYGPVDFPVYSNANSEVSLAAEDTAGRRLERSLANFLSVYTTRPDQGGNDTLSGGFANDFLAGGAGSDVLSGNSGNDVLIGDGGKLNFLSGRILSAETYPLFTGQGDELFAGSGQDVLLGGAGHDYFNGDMKEDILLGDYGRVSWTPNGVIDTVIRLGQGRLDLISATQFGIYSANKPMAETGQEAKETGVLKNQETRFVLEEPPRAPEHSAFASHHSENAPKEEQGREEISPEGMTFAEAFARARREGKGKGDTFEWKGRLYDAGLAEDVAEEKENSLKKETQDRQDAKPDTKTPGDKTRAEEGNRAATEIKDLAVAGLMGWQWFRSKDESKIEKKMNPEAFADLDRKMNQRRYREWTI